MRRLTVVVVALGLLVWLAAPALSAKPFVPRAVDFEQRVALGDGAVRAASGGWRSEVVEAPKRFDLVGFKWRAPEEIDARIRVRDTDGDWSRWTQMGHSHGARPGTEPVWAKGSEAYQLRLSRRPKGLRAHFVNVSGDATAADRARTAVRRVARSAFVALAGSAARAQGSGPPGIVPREAWGADQCKPSSAPSFGRVDAGLVHHTVSANAYSPEQAAAIVLSICRYHRNSNGWNDIGYNFLVDRHGRIYEGRAGGIDQAVIGAQAAGHNSVTTGVANIGTFSGAPQTPAGVSATAELLAWKLAVHGVPPQGTVPVGSRTLQRISGHRDVNSTACPGDALFAQLPQIRSRAAERAPAYARAEAGGLDLSIADRALTHPEPVRAEGRLVAPDGTPTAGQEVLLQVRSGSKWRTVRGATTDGDGRYAADVPTAWDRTVRATALVPGRGPVTSLSRSVTVTPTVEVAVAARRVASGGRLVVRGRSRPSKQRFVVEVARKTSGGGYRVVARLPARGRRGRFSDVVRPRRAALTRIRVLTRADSRNQTGRSAPVYVRVVSRRRAATGGADTG